MKQSKEILDIQGMFQWQVRCKETTLTGAEGRVEGRRR
jgi:hypothetical protein